MAQFNVSKHFLALSVFLSLSHTAFSQMLACPLEAPETVTLDYVTHNAAALSWDIVENSSGYFAKLHDLSDGSSDAINLNPNYMVYDARFIQAGHDYEFIVNPKCSDGSIGAPSEVLRFKAREIIIIDIIDRFKEPTTETLHTSLDIQIFPTNVESFLQFTLNAPPTTQLESMIMNMNGQVISTSNLKDFTGNRSENQLVLPVQDLKPGIYILTVRTDTQIKTQKFIKL